MSNEEYMNMLYIFDDAFDNEQKLIVEWENGLRVSCLPITGTYETDSEAGDENYIGDYATAIGDIEILDPGSNNTVEIYKYSIEISLKSIPKKVSSEDGDVLWKR